MFYAKFTIFTKLTGQLIHEILLFQQREYSFENGYYTVGDFLA